MFPGTCQPFAKLLACTPGITALTLSLRQTLSDLKDFKTAAKELKRLKYIEIALLPPVERMETGPFSPSNLLAAWELFHNNAKQVEYLQMDFRMTCGGLLSESCTLFDRLKYNRDENYEGGVVLPKLTALRHFSLKFDPSESFHGRKRLGRNLLNYFLPEALESLSFVDCVKIDNEFLGIASKVQGLKAFRSLRSLKRSTMNTLLRNSLPPLVKIYFESPSWATSMDRNGVDLDPRAFARHVQTIKTLHISPYTRCGYGSKQGLPIESFSFKNWQSLVDLSISMASFEVC